MRLQIPTWPSRISSPAKTTRAHREPALLFEKPAAIAYSDDQQIVRIENHAGLNCRHGDCRSLGSIGAVVERLVRGIEVEFGTESRELIVAGSFEERRHVHAGGQPAAETICRDRYVVVLGGIVEVRDRARAVGGLQEREGIVAAAAGRRVIEKEYTAERHGAAAGA